MNYTCVSAGLWPYAFTEEAIERSVMSADAFRMGLEASPQDPGLGYRFIYNITFNNGTAEAQMPAVFVTPDESRPLPTVVLTTGTDFTKEVSEQAIGNMVEFTFCSQSPNAHCSSPDPSV